MAAVHLVGEDGERVGQLRPNAAEIISEAEEMALTYNLAKRSCLPLALRQHVETAGFAIDETLLQKAIERLDAVRRGEDVPAIEVNVRTPAAGGNTPGVARTEERTQMIGKHRPLGTFQFFEIERVYPEDDARAWYEHLVGLDEHKQRLLVELELLLYPQRLETWSKKHHRRTLRLCEILRQRVPLVLLEGDVGCGKTALAETVGDALARQTGSRVHLLKVNTQVRGSGHVGEMSDLIAQAFAQAEARAVKTDGEPVLLLIDEADALAARREDQHMHHEDKAGLNTLLQRIDSLRFVKQRIAVMFITNRPDALDPAVRRRAALRLTFERPGDNSRAELFRRSVPELKLTECLLKELVTLTGPHAPNNKGLGFTASDITDRLFSAALREAYSADRDLRIDDLITAAKALEPSPSMTRHHASD